VKVPVPWIDEEWEQRQAVCGETGSDFLSEDSGETEEAIVPRPRRTVKEILPSSKKPKRVPVSQRWFYEPVLAATPSTEQDHMDVQGNKTCDQFGEGIPPDMELERNEGKLNGGTPSASESLPSGECTVLAAIGDDEAPLTKGSNGTMGSKGGEKLGEETSSVSLETPRGERDTGSELGARGKQGPKTKKKLLEHLDKIVGSQSKSLVSASKKDFFLGSASEVRTDQWDPVLKMDNLLGSKHKCY
jgi:hypothetical protein